jgi:hypothetical protein
MLASVLSDSHADMSTVYERASAIELPSSMSFVFGMLRDTVARAGAAAAAAAHLRGIVRHDTPVWLMTECGRGRGWCVGD